MISKTEMRLLYAFVVVMAAGLVSVVWQFVAAVSANAP